MADTAVEKITPIPDHVMKLLGCDFDIRFLEGMSLAWTVFISYGMHGFVNHWSPDLIQKDWI